MKFNGTIIITDPWYIAKEGDWCKLFDWENNKITDKFTHYLWETTSFEENSWFVYSSDRCCMKKPSQIKRLLDDYIDDENYEIEDNFIGDLCSESASLGVFYLDEALNYNESGVKDLINNLPHCVTVIENFEGDIINYETCDGNCHFIGTGNTTFYTI